MLSATPSIFEAQTLVSATPEVLFAFHADPQNLSVVMPPTMKLVSISTDGLAEEGRLIELHCRDWWVIPMHWVCRWKVVSPPGLLVDEIVQAAPVLRRADVVVRLNLCDLYIHIHTSEGLAGVI